MHQKGSTRASTSATRWDDTFVASDRSRRGWHVDNRRTGLPSPLFLLTFACCLSLSLLIFSAAWLSASVPLHFLLLSSYYVRRMKTSVNNYSIRPTVHKASLRRRNFMEVGVSVCLFEATIRRTPVFGLRSVR